VKFLAKLSNGSSIIAKEYISEYEYGSCCAWKRKESFWISGFHHEANANCTLLSYYRCAITQKRQFSSSFLYVMMSNPATYPMDTWIK